MDNNKVKPEEIEYISLEGGGGKGFAYLGAIDALNSIKGWDWKKIKGISGSSAGAITALLLSIGFTTKEQISSFMIENIKSETFFEPPNPRYIPRPGGYVEAPTLHSKLEISQTISVLVLIYITRELIMSEIAYTKSKDVTISYVNRVIKNINSAYNSVKRELLDMITGLAMFTAKNPMDIMNDSAWQSLNDMRQNKPFFSELANEKDVFTKAIDTAIQQLKKNIMQLAKQPDSSLSFIFYYLPQAIIYMQSDMGLFHGKKARDVFDKAIADAMGQSKANTTFKEHSDHFKKKLVVTGTNLTIDKTILFSCDETPDFPVADAIRISMSLPFVFKPYVIKEERKGYPPCGLYVDGGVFNNSPLHAFDDEIWAKQEEAQRNSFSLPLSKAIGLRLEFEEPSRLPVMYSPLNFYYPFFSKILYNGLFGAGESQVLKREANRYILLDSAPLNLLGFDPPNDDVVFKRSRRKVYRYFGLEPDPVDRDDNDDRESEKRRKKSDNPCG